MKILSRLMILGIILLGLACGGGAGTDKKAAQENNAALSLAESVCACIEDIGVEKADTMGYKLAVNTCVVIGMSESRKLENVGMNDLLEAIKTSCPEGYAVYQQ